MLDSRRVQALDVSADLRGMQRHALAMELRFCYRWGSLSYIGTGRTRNLGGEMICFETDQALRGRGDLELRIPWPSRLQSICDLELVVRGQLVRKDDTVAVIRVGSYEFETHGDRSFSQLARCGVNCNVAA
jgi:hypothetical protein